MRRDERAFRALAFVVLIAAFAGAGCSEGDTARAAVIGGDPDRGEALLIEYGCGSCHVIPGVRGARGTVGPPLTDWSDRQYIAGNLPNTPEDLIRWIVNPQAIEPGTVMPILGVTPDDARDMAAYLYTLGDALGPPHLFPESVLRQF